MRSPVDKIIERVTMPFTLISKWKSATRRGAEAESSSAPPPKKSSAYRTFFTRLHSSPSDPSLHTVKDRKEKDASVLPAKVMLQIVDYCDREAQQSMRRVSSTFRRYVDESARRITRLEVRKDDISACSAEDGWRHHPKAAVVVRVDGESVQIIVDTKWRTTDIYAVLDAMAPFRHTVVEATIDAPIAELLVVSLSQLDLARWYTFQCYMKAMNIFAEDCHLTVSPPPKKSREVYWPRLETLTVITTMAQGPHLNRLLDYGVSYGLVIDRQVIGELHIVVTDADDEKEALDSLNQDIVKFRIWAGSAGFDERFHVQMQYPQRVANY